METKTDVPHQQIDFWLLENRPVMQTKDKTWGIEAKGPPVELGDWHNCSNNIWRWIFKSTGTTLNEVIEGWEFSGEKPEFDSDKKRWIFTGQKPELLYRRAGSPLMLKFRVLKNGILHCIPDTLIAKKNLDAFEHEQNRKKRETTPILELGAEVFFLLGLSDLMIQGAPISELFSYIVNMTQRQTDAVDVSLFQTSSLEVAPIEFIATTRTLNQAATIPNLIRIMVPLFTKKETESVHGAEQIIYALEITRRKESSHLGRNNDLFLHLVSERLSFLLAQGKINPDQA